MTRVREMENEARRLKGKPDDPEERKPVDYFDLAAGTSTGGLIALMLFRLEMRCSDVIAQYDVLAKMVFSPMLGKIHLNDLGGFGKVIGDSWLKIKALTGHAQYSHKPLEQAIDAVVGQFPLDDDDRAKKGDAVLVKRSQGQM
jgi:patatin-like phospholipase/acyl hydrolase